MNQQRPECGRIVVVGGINMDLFIEAERFPRPGETFEGERFYTGGGGKGANQAIAAAQLTRPGVVQMVGQVGGDAFGEELLENFDRFRVGHAYVAVDANQSSGIALIFIDGSKENYVLPVYGANATCGERQVEDARKALGDARVLLVQQEISTEVTIRSMEIARELGVTVILDPAPVRDGLDDFVGLADILVPNQLEAEAITGIPVTDVASAGKAAKAIRRSGTKGTIVKLGVDGCHVDTDEVSGHFPAFDVTPVATVAAGDAFAGGLAVGLAEGRDFQESVKLALAAGSLSVAKPGAQDSMPTREEVERLLQQPAAGSG